MTGILTPAVAGLVLLGLVEPAFQPGGPIPILENESLLLDLDGDSDGISDTRDACPGTPAGYPAGVTGCALDSDGDGVADGGDACPGTRPSALMDDVDPKGCSAKDRRKERGSFYSLGVG